MTSASLINEMEKYVAASASNYISGEDAIFPSLAGMRIFDAPLVGFASAGDELFTVEYKKPGIIHPEYLAPSEWLPGAKTVISFFLPFTQRVRESNRQKIDEPYAPGIPQRCSPEWLHARIEGQLFVNELSDRLAALLKNEGFESVSPTTSGRLRLISPYISSWSERHAAYAAGLGTFGLSKGLITKKGMAGRFGSVITEAEFIPSVREYGGPFEYCSMCGACAAKCPVGAIDKAKGCALGKDQSLCGPYVNKGALPPHGPNKRVRYGCGKCQSGVPCEGGIPKNNVNTLH